MNFYSGELVVFFAMDPFTEDRALYDALQDFAQGFPQARFIVGASESERPTAYQPLEVGLCVVIC